MRLNADARFWEAIIKLARFVQTPASKLGAIAVDSTSSATVRVSFNDDLRRIANGILEGLQPTATEFVNRLRSEGLDPEAIAKKLAVVVVDTAPRELVASEMLRSVVGEDEASHAWAVLKNDGLTLIRRRSRRDTGIGQLIVHASSQRSTCRRVLVIPAGLTADLEARLKNNGIETLSYVWNHDVPEFPSLDVLLTSRRVSSSVG